uniref:Uncharacterized protein n=1 Tax=Chenopodium quinoa TaxID=63459 RepID=A0A803LL29_CHEQI
MVLRSWKSASDPSNGRFRLGMIPNSLPDYPEFITWDGDKRYWRSGPWSGSYFLGVPQLFTEASNGFRIIISIINNVKEGTLDILYDVANDSYFVYCVLNYDGNLILRYWDTGSRKWTFQWQSHQSECDIYGRCGSFGICNPNKTPICQCLRGFEPKNNDEWTKGNWTSGCVRRSPLQCSSNTGDKLDGFSKLKNIKVPDFPDLVLADDQDDCKMKCLGNCLCLACAFSKFIGCMIWNTSLIDLQQFSVEGADLFIRLAHSELGKRSSLINHDEFKDLVLFKFKKLVVATSNFSITNKLGQGGFGPVYKGKLEDGQEIAVKRLSKASGQGLQEFMNEVLVISKLQHNNLVRLLGCCVQREEKLLVYEYMPNKSLDALLFDTFKNPHYQKQLDWKKRFNIINGICRGLLYLHRDSRILEWQGSSGQNKIKPNTLRVVGTYGYMSPEYAMEGRFSEKSDIFSLGVILLEIVSGRKNNKFLEFECLSLLTYAWKMWNRNDMLSLIDPTVFDPCYQSEMLKCIQLGLICVQEFPEDRPTILTLVSMLDANDIMELPQPKQPGFTHWRDFSTDEANQIGQQYDSINHVSVTVLTGR